MRVTLALLFGLAAGALAGALVSPDSLQVVRPRAGDFADGAARVEITLDVIAKPGERIYGSNAIYSAQSDCLVYVVRRGEKKVVVVDGVAGPEYDEIIEDPPEPYDYDAYYASSPTPPPAPPKGLFLSPDGRRFAYAAKRSGQWYWIVDGKEIGPYDEVSGRYFLFSPNSKRFACKALRDGKGRVIIDGREQDASGSVRQLQFSENSRHVRYFAKRGGAWHRVEDSRYGKAYEHCRYESSRETGGGRYCLLAGDGSRLYVDGTVVDASGGRESASRSRSSATGAGPAGSSAASGGSSNVRFLPDGYPVGAGVSIDGETTLADGRLCYAYREYEEREWKVVVGDKEGPALRRPFEVVWRGKGYGKGRIPTSPDRMHIYYLAEECRHAFGRTGYDSIVLVVDTKVRGRVADAKSFSYGLVFFSADGRHLAFLARAERQCFICVDGVKKYNVSMPSDTFHIGPIFEGVIGDTYTRVEADDTQIYRLTVRLISQ